MKELVAVVVDAKGVETHRIYAVPAGSNGVKINITEPSVPVIDAPKIAGKTLRVESVEYKEFRKKEAAQQAEGIKL